MSAHPGPRLVAKESISHRSEDLRSSASEDALRLQGDIEKLSWPRRAPEGAELGRKGEKTKRDRKKALLAFKCFELAKELIVKPNGRAAARSNQELLNLPGFSPNPCLAAKSLGRDRPLPSRKKLQRRESIAWESLWRLYARIKRVSPPRCGRAFRVNARLDSIV